MDAKELFVHNRSQGKRAKRLDASLVNAFTVFVSAFEFEGKVIREVPALVISSQKPKRIGIPEF